MPPPVPLPAYVQAWLRSAFGSCDEQVSTIVSRVPTNHETTLDMSFIDYFAAIATPLPPKFGPRRTADSLDS